MTSDPDPNQSG